MSPFTPNILSSVCNWFSTQILWNRKDSLNIPGFNERLTAITQRKKNQIEKTFTSGDFLNSLFTLVQVEFQMLECC